MIIHHPYLGIDIGGSYTRLGLFASLARTAFKPLASFPTRSAYPDFLEHIGLLRREYYLTNLAGVGISVGAQVAQDGRSIIFGPNLPEYLAQPLANDLENLLQCQVRLGHDTVCGLLGEKLFGSLRGIERCAYLTVSTGTGAALQLGKGGTELISSIEIGHQILDGNKRLCLCGQVGCLETFTGGRQLELRYGRPITEFADDSFWQTFASKLALGLLNLVQLTRIEAVAVGGSIALQNHFLLPLLQENINKLLKNRKLLLLRAELGEHSPLIGAVSLFSVPESIILH